ncbi:NADH:flavin oxidoreductase [Candidatus Bathyarchaeota archaeon]|nr:NADH:flavin oxidoreductase [Candidatus Bathyarchaeota archaeon]MDP6048661.1 FAD-dependent oxidoreductase [Candidatus Bathyarchaeota archaeon]MDP7442977.1 FAD-dependent oxidoreductase [Candidatus Bathyarchaeota archaeon]
MTALTRLFEPIRIGTMEVKNRIVMPPMGTRFASVSGEATSYHINHYFTRAQGGTGLLIVPWVLVDTTFEKKTGRLRIDTDEHIRGLNDIVEAVHIHKAKIAIQLSLGGRAISSSEAVGEVPIAPSKAFCAPYGTTARALTLDEIDYLVEAFAKASFRAKEAGFDAIEYHGASGYLISQFLSPFVNKRTDAYGGTPQKRLTFLLEIIERTREKVGKDFPQMVRISGDEFIEGGLTLEDNKFIAKNLADAGVSCIDVTMGIVESYHKAMPPMCIPRAAYVHLAQGIKETVDIPVIAVGRINDPRLAEQILVEGKADLVAMGRALFADPELPIKARRGKFDDITPCFACLRCEMATSRNIRVHCTVNPNLGRIQNYPLSLAKQQKRVLVIGGGPAGMTAATVAAQRGHDVTLYEKQGMLGGQLILAGTPPLKEEINYYTDYLVNQAAKSGVNIVLRKEVTRELVQNETPDAVVVATGSVQIIPRIPGVDGPNVVSAWEVLAGEFKAKDNVFVVGGGMVGLETAEYLAEKGKTVAVIEMLSDVGIDMEPFSKVFLLERFQEMGVRVFTSMKVNKISSDSLEATGANSKKHVFKAGTVVIAVGSRSCDELYDSLEGQVNELYKIGDCVRPSRILEAIHEATFVAYQI